jgi:ABC-type glycerol-3-phosphate transport system substrate-binding protein
VDNQKNGPTKSSLKARKITRRRFLKGVSATGLGIAAMSSFGSFATKAYGASPMKLSLWCVQNPQQFPYLRKRAQLFMEKNPNVQIEMQQMLISDLGKKVNLGFATGTAPDGFQTGTWLMPIWLDKDLVAPMDVTKLGYSSMKSFVDDYPKAYIESSVKNGKAYAFPLFFYGWLNYMNLRHFKEAGLDPIKDEPATWEQMGEVAKRLTIKKGQRFERQGFKFAMHAPLWTMVQFNPILLQCGGKWFDEKGKCVVNSPAGVKAMTIRRSISKDYGAEDPADSIATNPIPMMDFVRERASMFCSHPISPVIFRENNPEMERGQYYKGVQMPGVKANQRYSSCYGVVNLINKQISSSKQEVLHDVYRFMMADLVACWAEAKPFPPARKSGWRTNPEVQQFPNVNAIFKAQEDGAFLPNSVVFDELQDVMHRAIQRIILNNADIQQTLNEAAAEVDRANAQYRAAKKA